MADLLDTMIISEPRKPKPAPEILTYFHSRDLNDMYLSTVTLAEIRWGIDAELSPLKRAALQQWLDATIRPMFAGRTLELSESILLQWRILMANGRKRNHTYSQPDLFLAATDIEHDLTLVTRNTRDFAGIAGLKLLNPWEALA